MFRNLIKKSACIVIICLMMSSIFVGFAQMVGADDPTPKPMADWTVSGVEEINDYIHYQRGNVIIPMGATLTITNGGLIFTQDLGDDGVYGTLDDHIYSLTIQNGGSLIMQNSILSTRLDELYNYPKLTFIISSGGSFQATDSIIKFPGIISTLGASVKITNSTITGHSSSDIDRYVGNNNGIIGTDEEDDNDDAPIMYFNSTTVQIYDSRIEKLYENAISPNIDYPFPDYRFDITLTGSTTMTVVNSYVGIDFSPSASLHNTILANSTGAPTPPMVYIYNMTIDESQTPAPALRRPPLVPWGPTNFDSFGSNVTAWGPSHTAGGLVSDLWDHDVTNQVVVQPTQRLFADSWDLPGWQFTTATLRVIYTPQANYNGNQPIQWALDGQLLQPTTIIPTENGGVEVVETFDLFAEGVDTLAKLATLDISFYNSATNGTQVSFDLMRVDLSRLYVSSDAKFYLYKWLDLTVTDEYNVPANGADITSWLLPGATQLAYYPDNSMATVPPSWILTYLGKDAVSYTETDTAGGAFIPLLSDIITRVGGIGTMPNSEFIGNYQIDAAYLNITTWFYGTKNFSFTPYPAMSWRNNTLPLTLKLPDVQIPRPDLTQNDCRYLPAVVYEGDIVNIQGNVSNIGDSPALNVYVTFFEGPNELGNDTIGMVGASSYALTSAIVWNSTTVGTHVININVDPLNTVSEKDEGNNNKGCSIVVNPNRPNLRIDRDNISFSANPVPNNNVDISAQISNTGRKNATNVLVHFYVDDRPNNIAEGSVDNSSVMELIEAGKYNVTKVGWIPPKNITYEVCVKVDPYNYIEEDFENDNFACNNLTVNPAPNLFIDTYDITFSDPFPKQGDTIDISAIIYNIGYVSSTTTFYVDFRVDGLSIGIDTVTMLAAGSSVPVAPTPSAWPATEYGWHTVSVHVDYTDREWNETNENDNVASRQIFVYKHPRTWYVNNSQTYQLDIGWEGNIEIRGSLTIKDSTLKIFQDEDNMHVVKVMGNGHLTLDNAVLTSNGYPLVVYVTGNGIFEVKSEVLLSSTSEEGLIYTDGNSILMLMNANVEASIRATGQYVKIYDSVLNGASLHIDTATTSYIWDTLFTGVDTIELKSDDSNPTTPDFNMGNLTFNQALTDQLSFEGYQFIKFTNVTTYIELGEDWYDGMLTENAKIARYWWLRVRHVDGTGTLIGPPDTSEVLIQRLEFNNNAWGFVNVYSGPTPTGEIIIAALSEVRYSVPAPHEINYTYHIQGNVTLDQTGLTYDPQEQKNVTVEQNMVVDLVYPNLLPDFSVVSIDFIGGNGDSIEQPINTPVYINATILNSGLVGASNAEVFYYTLSLIDYDYNNNGTIEPSEVLYAPIYDSAMILSIPASSTGVASILYTPMNPVTFSVFVDSYNTKTEINEHNNAGENSFSVYNWPDYRLVSIYVVPSAIQDTTSQLIANITNTGEGYGSGSNANVNFYDLTLDPGQTTPLNPTVITLGALTPGHSTSAQISWTPTIPGTHQIRAIISHPASTNIENMDYNLANNVFTANVKVKTQPDLEISNVAQVSTEIFQGTPFELSVEITNNGEASAYNFNVSVYYGSSSIGTISRSALGGIDTTTETIYCSGIPTTGQVSLTIVADTTDSVVESDETNNNATIDITISEVSGYIVMNAPLPGANLTIGSNYVAMGWLYKSDDNMPLQDITIAVELRDGSGNVLATASQVTSVAGYFEVEIAVPSDLSEGTYQVCGTTNFGDVNDECVSVRLVGGPFEFPWWLILILIIIIVAIIVAVVLYLRYRGLGKMVECGECGALIPEGSKKCPKCGVEFETETVKCSSCGAWIPTDVKSCPECGVEFVVGEVEAEDYQKQMRRQYDQYVNKQREEAKKIWPSMTEQEFVDWWKKQPSYISFTTWLREEEEKKRLGSAPCPICGTLNSVTATICHRCGTPLKKVEETVERRPPPAPRREVAPPEEPPEAPPEEPTPPPTAPVPKKVVKKPMETVVKKRVVRPGEPEK